MGYLADKAEEPKTLLFWDPTGWCVDLREDRSYPVYGEWDWVARTNNTGMEAGRVKGGPVETIEGDV